MTATASYWDLRFVVGTRQSLGIEAGYAGTVQRIQALGIDRDALLLSTALESDLRFHFLDGAWQPYMLVGAAWRRYQVRNADSNTSAMRDRDDVLEIPMGLGMAYRWQGLVLDGRAVYRAAADEDLLATRAEDESSLDNFHVSAGIGWEL